MTAPDFICSRPTLPSGRVPAIDHPDNGTSTRSTRIIAAVARRASGEHPDKLFEAPRAMVFVAGYYGRPRRLRRCEVNSNRTGRGCRRPDGTMITTHYTGDPNKRAATNHCRALRQLDRRSCCRHEVQRGQRTILGTKEIKPRTRGFTDSWITR